MTMLLVRGLSAVAVLLAVTGEDSCPAGAGSARCKAAPAGVAKEAASSTKPSRSTETHAEAPRVDLISQEVDQLKAFVKLCDERIDLLQELNGMVKTGVNLSLPDAHARILKEQLPLMSEVAVGGKNSPTGSAGDYLFSKAVIPQESPASFIKFLPLRNPRAGSSSSSAGSTQTQMPSVLLVAAENEGSVRLFNPAGELLLSFSSGHEQPLTHVAVSQGQDEYAIITADAGGLLRVHKVNVKQRRLTKEQRSTRRNSTDEKVSQFLGTQLNVTATFTKQMQVPPNSNGEQPKLTAVAMTSQHGSKYFVVGDEEGNIGVFTKNGTFSTNIKASATPGARVQSLQSHLSNLIVLTSSDWGYVDLAKHQVQRVTCPTFDGRVTAVAFDIQQASRILVSDEDGTVWVFNMKDRRNCKVEDRFPKGTTLAPTEIASIKGFAIVLDRAGHTGDPVTLQAMNMSQVGKKREHSPTLPSPVSWRTGRQAVRDWSVHKRYQAGDLVAFLSEDGHEIEVMELLMTVYTAPSQDNFGNFKMPVIGVAVVLVLGYQYMKNKGGGGGKGKLDKFDFSALKNNKRGLGALGGGLGGRKGGLGGLGGLAGRKGGLGRR